MIRLNLNVKKYALINVVRKLNFFVLYVCFSSICEPVY